MGRGAIGNERDGAQGWSVVSLGGGASPQMALTQQRERETPAAPASLKTYLQSSVTKTGVFETRKGDGAIAHECGLLAGAHLCFPVNPGNNHTWEREAKYTNWW